MTNLKNENNITKWNNLIFENNQSLIKSFRFEKNIVIRVAGISAILGIIFAGDYFTFGKLIPEVAADYEVGISSAYFFSSLIYGGIVEELMLRLFAMSLVGFILWKVFASNCSDVWSNHSGYSF